jgi:thioredoxin reductase (NADPH)
MEAFDLIIVGGGPAGLTAGIYGVRAELKSVIIESKIPGGQIATAGKVENYPGFPDGIMGMELAERMRMQAENIGVKIKVFEPVERIEREEGYLFLTTNKERYKGKAVIIATGLAHKKLKVPGEEEFFGRGVSYCATCDGPLFAHKKVAVLGGGTGAAMAALYLDDVADDVKMITEAGHIRVAEEIINRRLKESDMDILLHTKLKRIVGDQIVNGIEIIDWKGEERKIEMDGVFIEVGKDPVTAFLENLKVGLDGDDYIIVDRDQKTNIQGLYAAGDVTSNGIKQVGIAVAEGCNAALNAYEYVRSSSFIENG